MSDPGPDHWETRLKARLEQHGVADPVALVARWKAHRERAIAANLAFLRSQLAAAKADAIHPTEFDSAAGLDGAPPVERLTSIIHRRMGDAESRLQTSIRRAVDRIEHNQSESEKSLTILKERVPAPGQPHGRSDAAGGLGPVFVYGAATAAVVVTLVLALSAMLGKIGA